MRELQTGEIIDGLVVKERIGSGGMGEVYLVHDPELAVDRALKVVALTGPGFTGSSSEAREYRERFLREARTLAKLRHPSIIAVHSTGELDGNPYIVMTYFPSVDGRAWLNALADGGAPALGRVRHVALQAARALAHAHEHGVLHRDIKLGNLLIGKDDEAMLIDFGLAKSAADRDLTRVGRTMGTFSYLAPEYVKAADAGENPKHTVATDLWAFGCLLYAFTCRAPAFRNKDEVRLLRLVARAQFTPVKARAPDVPDDWATLIHQLMEPDPARRLPTAAQLVARLESVQLGRSAAVAVPPAPPPDDDAPTSKPVAVHLAESVVDELPEVVEIADDADAPEHRTPPGPAATDLSIFDDERPEEETASGPYVRPSFQAPPERPSSARMNARKGLLLPLAAALAVLLLGGAGVAGMSHLGRAGRSPTAYTDPDELERKRRAASEVDEIAKERAQRATVARDAAQPMAAVPMFAPAGEPDTARSPAQPSKPAQPPRGRAASSPTPAAEPAAPVPADPWRQRYGNRTSYNTSAGPAAIERTVPAPAGSAAVAGMKIPVRVKDAIASAPAGPVIAIVQATTKVGDLDIPRGAEIHGRIVGARGPRILLEFSFAIVGGMSVPLRGIALGTDGRAGVPGAKNVGGVSDVAAGGAAGALQAAVGVVAGALGDGVARGAVEGGGAAVVGKASRFDNEETLVLAEPGARFVVYVDGRS